MKLDPLRKKRGNELRQFRIEKKLNQQQLALLSGLSTRTIMRIENGTIGWNIDSEILYFEALKNYILVQT